MFSACLLASCQSGEAINDFEICDNQQDDDGDNLVDCQDPQRDHDRHPRCLGVLDRDPQCLELSQRVLLGIDRSWVELQDLGIEPAALEQMMNHVDLELLRL